MGSQVFYGWQGGCVGLWDHRYSRAGRGDE